MGVALAQQRRGADRSNRKNSPVSARWYQPTVSSARSLRSRRSRNGFCSPEAALVPSTAISMAKIQRVIPVSIMRRKAANLRQPLSSA